MIWPKHTQGVIRDILSHALNNIADHGYILPRKADPSLPARPVWIQVSAKAEAEALKIEISDGGYGLNFSKLRQVASKRGLGDDLSDETLLKILMDGGLSTADEVSKTSGRGVGVAAITAIAKENGGSALIRPRAEGGTTIAITLPREALNQELREST